MTFTNRRHVMTSSNQWKIYWLSRLTDYMSSVRQVFIQRYDFNRASRVQRSDFNEGSSTTWSFGGQSSLVDSIEFGIYRQEGRLPKAVRSADVRQGDWSGEIRINVGVLQLATITQEGHRSRWWRHLIRKGGLRATRFRRNSDGREVKWSGSEDREGPKGIRESIHTSTGHDCLTVFPYYY